MFAILGQNLLKGKLGYCNMSDNESYYGVSQSQCLSKGHQWETHFANFDNVLVGLQTLFILSTQEDWPAIMEAAMDANDADIVINAFLFNLSSNANHFMIGAGQKR